MRSSLAQTIPFMYRPPMQFSSMPCATIMLTQNPPKINKTTLDQKDKKREHTQTRRKSFDVPDPRQPCRSIPTTNNPGVQHSSSLTTRSNVQVLDRRSLFNPTTRTKNIYNHRAVPRIQPVGSIPSMPRLSVPPAHSFISLHDQFN